MKIFLIGMPGSGKTTLGKQLASELQVRFVDLDDEIVQEENASIPEIFRTKGEDHFRMVESRLLHRYAASSESFVMATGGGAPCFHNGMQVINQSGLSIFFDVDVPELLNRLKSKTDRPLLSDDFAEKEKKLQSLRAARLDCYNQSRIRIVNPDLHKVLTAIRAGK